MYTFSLVTKQCISTENFHLFSLPMTIMKKMTFRDILEFEPFAASYVGIQVAGRGPFVLLFLS